MDVFEQLDDLITEVGERVRTGDPTDDKVKEDRKFYVDLVHQRNDYAKTEVAQAEAEARVEDNEIKQKQLADQKVDRWVRIGLTSAEILIPTAAWLLAFGSTLKADLTTVLGPMAKRIASLGDRFFRLK